MSSLKKKLYIFIKDVKMQKIIIKYKKDRYDNLALNQLNQINCVLGKGGWRKHGSSSHFHWRRSKPRNNA